jgi:hypothetical protein
VFGKRDMSIDGQFRRKNIKAWVITLLVAAILFGGTAWLLQTSTIGPASGVATPAAHP